MVLVPDKSIPLRIIIPTPSGDVVLLCKHPTDEEKDRFRRKRTKWIRGEVATDPNEDVKFINMLLIGCEDIEILESGQRVALDPKKHPDWKNHVDRDWKLSAALAFATPLGKIVSGQGGDVENF